MHNDGQDTYAARHGLDLERLAIEHWKRYQSYLIATPRLPW